MSIFVAPKVAPAKAGPVGSGAGVLLTEYPLMSILGNDPHQKMRTAYKIGMSVIWIRRAEALIGSKLATIDFDLDDSEGEEINAEHPSADARAALDLLEHPQALLEVGTKLSRSALWRVTSRHLGLAGNAFWLLDRPEAYSGTPAAIAYIRPDRMTPNEDAAGNLLSWQIDKTPRSAGIKVELNQIVHFMLEPPDSGHFGPGLVETALLRGQISTALDRHLGSVISAGGRLSGFISPKEGIIAAETMTQLERDYRTIVEQPDAAKRLQLIAAPIEFTKTTMTPAELDIVKVMELSRDDLLAFWNVPGSLLGVRIAAGLNSGETRKFDEAALWQGPVHDRLVILGEGIEDGILSRWQKRMGWIPELRFEEPEFDDDTPLYENAEKAKVLPLTNAERRHMIGKDPFGDTRDDEIWLPATMVPAFTAPGEAPAVSAQISQTPAGEAPSDAAVSAAGETIEGKASPVEPLRRSLLALRDQMAEHHTPRIRNSVAAVLDEQRRDVAARLRGHAEAVSRKPRDSSVWWDAKKWDQALRSALTGALAGMATAVSRQVAEVLPAKASLSAVDRVLERGAARVTGINARTRDALQAWIVAGIEAGSSPADLADAIEAAVLDNGTPVFDEYRAELIARTELMDAYNASALYSYSDAGIGMVQAIDGDKDDECAARNGREFSVEEASGIEDHPNGTLDWVPVIGKASPLLRYDERGEPVNSAEFRELKAMLSQMGHAPAPIVRFEPAPVNVPAPIVTVEAPPPPAVTVDTTQFAAALRELAETIRSQPAPIVNVPPPVVTIPPRTRTVHRDEHGNIVSVTEE